MRRFSGDIQPCDRVAHLCYFCTTKMSSQDYTLKKGGYMSRNPKPVVGSVESLTLVTPEEQAAFCKVYQLFSAKVLEDIGDMKAEIKVLMWMLAQRGMMRTQASGYMECQQELLGATIKVGRPAVNKAMQVLKAKGYIEQLRPRSTVWRIKPELAFRGSLNTYWNVTPKKDPFGVDVWSPWSEDDRRKVKAGEQPLPGLEEMPPAKAM